MEGKGAMTRKAVSESKGSEVNETKIGALQSSFGRKSDGRRTGGYVSLKGDRGRKFGLSETGSGLQAGLKREKGEGRNRRRGKQGWR